MRNIVWTKERREQRRAHAILVLAHLVQDQVRSTEKVPVWKVLCGRERRCSGLLGRIAGERIRDVHGAVCYDYHVFPSGGKTYAGYGDTGYGIVAGRGASECL